MGESYLQIKLLGRLKRMRTTSAVNEQPTTTQAILMSSLIQPNPTSSTSQAQQTEQQQQQQQQPSVQTEERVELLDELDDNTTHSSNVCPKEARPAKMRMSSSSSTISIPQSRSFGPELSDVHELDQEQEENFNVEPNDSEEGLLVLHHRDNHPAGGTSESLDFSSSFTSNETNPCQPQTTNDSSPTTDSPSPVAGVGARKSTSLAALAAALTRGGGSSQRSNSNPSQQHQTAVNARLRSATKAIFFFRRAASSLTHRHLHFQQHRDLSGDNTNTNISNPRTISHSISSYNTHANAAGGQVVRQNTGDSSQSLGAQSQFSGSNANNNACNTSIYGTELPRFIVPKMNALRLPLVCLIKSLEGELMREVFVHRYELGEYLIENLKVSLGVSDTKYFGLKLAKSVDDQEDLHNPWLDLNESVCKQIKNKVNSQILAQQQQLQLAQQQQQHRSDSLTSGTNAQSSGLPAKSQAATTSASSSQPLAQSNATTSGGSPAPSTSTSARSIEFYLRIKFYPPNLARVQDAFLRQYLWLQLRRDLRQGKLTSSMNNLTLLMACVLQYELGDYREEDSVMREQLVPNLNILPNQDLIEEQAMELWRNKLKGLKRHQAQMQFLRAAVILETYGFDYYPVRDHQRQRAYLLGFNYAGIKTIRNGRIVHHFRWHSLSKISYERRMIIFHIYPTENSKRKQVLGFKCLSNEDCQNLYMRLLEQKYFFTVDLAYFDKSIRRPSCLYTTSTSYDWSNTDVTDNHPQHHHQHEHHHQTQHPQQYEHLVTGKGEGRLPVQVRSNQFSRSFSSRSTDENELDLEMEEFEQHTLHHNHNHHRQQNPNHTDPSLDHSSNRARSLHHQGGCMAADIAVPTIATSCLIKSPNNQQCLSSGEAACGSACPNTSTIAAQDTSTSTQHINTSDGLLSTTFEANSISDVALDTNLQHRSYQPSRLERQQSTLQYYGPVSIEQSERAWNTKPNEQLEWSTQASHYDNWQADEIPSHHQAADGCNLGIRNVCEVTNNAQTNGQGSSKRRLVELIESILIQPASTLLTLFNTSHSEAASPTNTNPTRSLFSPRGSILVSAIRFCVLILVMDFILRLTDSFSSALIGLLTLSSVQAETATTTAPTLDQEDLLSFFEL